MANGHGGYRKPSKPAAVSGPGALSKRTDGGPGTKQAAALDLPYGDRKMVEAGEAAAPISQPKPAPRPRPSSTSAAASGGLPPELFQESSRPNEPGTAGMDEGPGPGREALQNLNPTDPVEVALEYFAKTYNFLPAQEALIEYRSKRAPVQAPTLAPPMAPEPQAAPAPMSDDLGLVAAPEETLEEESF